MKNKSWEGKGKNTVQTAEITSAKALRSEDFGSHTEGSL